MTFHMQTADRSNGEIHLTYRVHANGLIDEQLVISATWQAQAPAGLKCGDVVKFDYIYWHTGRPFSGTQHGFVVGMTSEGQTVVGVEKDHEGFSMTVYYLTQASRLTFVYRPRQPITTLADKARSYQAFQKNTSAPRCLIIRDVQAPHQLGDIYLNRRQARFTVCGTDLLSGRVAVSVAEFGMYFVLDEEELTYIEKAQ